MKLRQSINMKAATWQDSKKDLGASRVKTEERALGVPVLCRRGPVH